MKIVIKEEVGSVYKLENGILMYAPLSKYNDFDTEDFNEVDMTLANEVNQTSGRTLGEIWQQARNVLEN